VSVVRVVWPVARDLAYSVAFCTACVTLVWVVNR
jgi:hypothetical protein